MRAKQSIWGVMEREGSIITEVEPCEMGLVLGSVIAWEYMCPML